MNVWELPTSLEIGGVGFAIRSDFRAVLDVLKAFNDPDLEDDEKAIVCLKILYEDFDKSPQEKYEEAFQKAVLFPGLLLLLAVVVIPDVIRSLSH